MAYHFWRVRKAGGIYPAKIKMRKEMIPTYPNLVYREFIVALALISSCTCLFSFF